MLCSIVNGHDCCDDGRFMGSSISRLKLTSFVFCRSSHCVTVAVASDRRLFVAVLRLLRRRENLQRFSGSAIVLVSTAVAVLAPDAYYSDDEYYSDDPGCTRQRNDDCEILPREDPITVAEIKRQRFIDVDIQHGF